MMFTSLLIACPIYQFFCEISTCKVEEGKHFLFSLSRSFGSLNKYIYTRHMNRRKTNFNFTHSGAHANMRHSKVTKAGSFSTFQKKKLLFVRN